MRLDRFLSESTELTRSLAKKALHRGEVEVNGDVVKNAAFKLGDEHVVRWLGEPLARIGVRYLMLNKPAGYECTTRPGRYPSVIELLDVAKRGRLHIAGRLDVDTTGLVLITEDGQWSHRLTSPRRRCDKHYLVTLARPLAEGAETALAEGLMLEGEDKPTLPARLERLDDADGVRVRLVIQEGRFHQIKRMFAALDNEVVALHRERIGEIALDPALAAGEWRELTQAEIDTV
ncbi:MULTISPECIES: 16S rRNA pseudouridine(516) synthase RsuA [Chromohalobacter]|jgi:16S rRNA pseudouridine516 synthase|uniref:Ribosomal small subunit pseudouridine synthase A n=1 Tax=Chromohalobacter israelensis (strain ATCC BAA-138 / DSM 3043 / CIP 106854 / NCIMB 13768 / 1H11) TaxID=290398 RepID=Q1QW56_CHRI1|nr:MULTISPECIES: 16S rRNA pseudouridine(516) synthase RsuA [Chromohalobacter]ABE59302.1 ribosomal small subunit pseudouridine synthase A [Chromohalobacter salexigens DSM 3043]NQY46729.1 16S rRNA pseudouridine(516) synthase RsuA [Chromohalobacter sp.]NWO56704.1 16S rRNA pseudouridine(516) synthase RsuA [Chromohalobacter salexigens]PWW40604.1 ribosomal small subunit pseudouridine synthase A [Chromohalobacter salexigens]